MCWVQQCQSVQAAAAAAAAAAYGKSEVAP